MRITVYDGAGVIGGNKILLEDAGANLFFDFGINFNLRNRYFEEYLPPRARRGLLDMFRLGFLPALRGIYRPDLELSDVDIWSKMNAPYPVRDLELHGVLLSHAHLDHSGHLSFLREDIPVISSLCTAYMAKAIQDTSKSDFEKEVCYVIPKVNDGGLLQSGHYRKYPAKQRCFSVCDCSPNGDSFWESYSSSRGMVSKALLKADKVGGLKIQAFAVDHSVYGATAYAVETSQGWLVYTGDMRTHGKSGAITREFARKAAALKPVALVCEGTHVEVSLALDEATVHDRCLQMVKDCDNLVIADFGPRNLERLLTFRDIAKDCGRKLVVTPKDIYLLDAVSLAGGQFLPPATDSVIEVYDELKKPDSWEEEILSRFEGRRVNAGMVRKDPGSYILCFSFWDINELVEIDPAPGATYIYSSSEAYDEEQRLLQELERELANVFEPHPGRIDDRITDIYQVMGNISEIVSPQINNYLRYLMGGVEKNNPSLIQTNLEILLSMLSEAIENAENPNHKALFAELKQKLEHVERKEPEEILHLVQNWRHDAVSLFFPSLIGPLEEFIKQLRERDSLKAALIDRKSVV